MQYLTKALFTGAAFAVLLGIQNLGAFAFNETTPPALTAASPALAATDISTLPTLIYTFSDMASLSQSYSSIAINSFNLSLGGEQVVLNGMCQSGFTCDGLPQMDAVTFTLKVHRDAPYALGEAVLLDATFEDTADVPNPASIHTTAFTVAATDPDITPPHVVSTRPAANGIAPLTSSLFTFEINLADNVDIDRTTLEVFLDNTLLVSRGNCQVFQVAYCQLSIPPSPLRDFSIGGSLFHSFPTGSQHMYTIELSDKAGNAMAPVQIPFSMNQAPFAPTDLRLNVPAAGTQSAGAEHATVPSGDLVFSAVYSDPDNQESELYRIQVARDEQFSDIIYDTDPGPIVYPIGPVYASMPTVASGQRSSDIPLQLDLENNHSYYWRISFQDITLGDTEFSAPQMFTVYTPPVSQVYTGGGGGAASPVVYQDTYMDAADASPAPSEDEEALHMAAPSMTPDPVATPFSLQNSKLLEQQRGWINSILQHAKAHRSLPWQSLIPKVLDL